MGGWNIDVDSIKVEQLEETNPEIYCSNAISETRKHNYGTALHFAKKALEYADNSIRGTNRFSHHLLILEILLHMKKYSEFLQYIEIHHFIEKIYANNEKGVLVGIFFTLYVECWKNVRWNLDDKDTVIVV